MKKNRSTKSRIYLLLTILLVGVVYINCLSQDDNSWADDLFDQKKFEQALPKYVKEYEKGAATERDIYRIALCYENMRQNELSVPYLKELSDKYPGKLNYKYKLAQAQMCAGNYKEAKDNLSSYGKLSKIGTYDYLAGLEKTDIVTDDFVDVERLKLNSSSMDFAPYVIDNNLFFVSSRTKNKSSFSQDKWSGQGFCQLYFISEDEIGNGKTNPEIFKKDEISDKYHEGPIGVDPSTNDLYFTRNRYKESSEDASLNHTVNLQIFKSEYQDSKQDYSTNFENPFSWDNKYYTVAFPSFSPDGEYMVFAGNMLDSYVNYGGLDLYYCKKNDGAWTEPVNLGDRINTPGNETYPFIDNNGRLYFSSNGHFGYGGLDIYITDFKPDNFNYLEHLKAPINSSTDDYGYYIDESNSKGYFASNRDGRFNDDIYSFEKNVIRISGKVLDKISNASVPNVSLVVVNDSRGTDQKLITDDQGYFEIELEQKSKYRFDVDHEGYDKNSTIYLTKSDDDNINIVLDRIYEPTSMEVVVNDLYGNPLPYANVIVKNEENYTKQVYQTDGYGVLRTNVNTWSEFSVYAEKDEEIPCISYDDYAQVVVNTYGKKQSDVISKTVTVRRPNCNGVEKVYLYYNYDESDVRNDAEYSLDKLLRIFKAQSDYSQLQIISYADCRGTMMYNEDLAEKRSNAIAKYLIKQRGVKKRNLVMLDGGGEKDLTGYCYCGNFNPDCDEFDHQLNRVTIVTIVE